MAKIVIIAPAGAEDVDDAVKLLKAAGHDVDTEEPTPKSLLHIVLGLLSPSGYGFGPGYGLGPIGEVPSEDDDEPKDEEPVEDAGADEGGGDMDFNFESLGTVSVDGELIEAVRTKEETSKLFVEGLVSGPKTTYALNESIFSFWPANEKAPAQRVEVIVEKHRTSIELPIEKATANPQLHVGADLISMFETKV